MIQKRREVTKTKTSRLPRGGGRSLGREQESGTYLIFPRLSPTGRELTTDHVNIGPDPPKMLSYWPVGSSGNTALKLL